MNFIEIQSWSEIPQIGFFASLFSSSFNLPEFDIEDLEEALLLDSSEAISPIQETPAEFSPRLIPELIVSLLKGCDLLVQSWSNITTSNYQMFLRRIFRHKCEEYNIENPFNTDVDFHTLSLRTKVIILNYLCDFRFDSSDVESTTNKLEADSLRIQPLGFDSNDSIYWYFFGTRLYREDYKKQKGNQTERVWQVICFTEEDWYNLANKFKSSKSRKEQNLYKCLTNNFLPNIPILFKAKEAERRRRLFQRRSSQRVKDLKEQRKQKDCLGEYFSEIDEENSVERANFSQKYLNEKKREEEIKTTRREKIQQERLIRAQRRPSNSSEVSNSSNELLSLTTSSHKNQLDSPSNKENILLKKDTKDIINVITKMPPVVTKLPGRQTNNSLSSITGHIEIPQPPQSSQTTSAIPVVPRKKKVKPEIFNETDEVLQIGMHKVLQHVKNHDDAWPFMDPVEEDIAPRYYSIIKRPMDLLKMEEKLDNGEYQTFTEFRTDFKLIVNNCRLYNGQNNEYTQMVNNLQIAFDRSTKKYFDQSSSDEEQQVLLEYPPIEVINKSKKKMNENSGNVSKNEEKKIHKHSKKELIVNNNNKNTISEKKGVKRKLEKSEKVIEVVKDTIKNKRKTDKNINENVKSKKAKNMNDLLDQTKESDRESATTTINSNADTKKVKKKAKNIILKEVKSNKKCKERTKAIDTSIVTSTSQKASKKQTKHKVKSIENVRTLKVNKNENNKNDSKYSDFSSECESIKDLINENSSKLDRSKKLKNKKGAKETKKINEKKVKQSKQKHHKHKILSTPLKAEDESISDDDSSPTKIKKVQNTSSALELNDQVKNKFDLIKERRQERTIKERGKVKEESEKVKKSLDKLPKEKSMKKEKRSAFDDLFDDHIAKKGNATSEDRGKVNDQDLPLDTKTTTTPRKNKQKASLDVLDLETEQTLKDINKWLEHTPRFEYSSESNSPSRFIIEDMDVQPTKEDENDDFRKPIPLMPSSSSPSSSRKDLNSVKKEESSVKDTESNKSGQAQVQGSIKKSMKELKRKIVKDKQQLTKRKEVQRTIDRLQPGKTKGNLLNTIQNINKPEELFPLGNREKVKEIKSSLTVETDENSPKLNLGKVLDANSFNFSNSKLEKESYNDKEIDESIMKTEKSCEDENILSSENEDASKNNVSVEQSVTNNKEEESTNSTVESAKPNLNAWFKAFGVSKKAKEVNKEEVNDMKPEGVHLIGSRRISTGSSVSEKSSIGDSPLEERTLAPAPSPIGASPISASPISATTSPSIDVLPRANYVENNTSTRVGFYQDTTSTKSSPEKSCSPHEILSPYQNYMQQANMYNSASTHSVNPYGNFYNQDPASKQRPINCPEKSNASAAAAAAAAAVYYNQYKQNATQEVSNSMSPNATNQSNSPYNSQQSSPYQPSSPFQSTNISSEIHVNNSTTAAASISSPNSPYSQPNSPYQQNQPSPYNSQAQISPQIANQNYSSQFSSHQNSAFEQQQQQEVTQFSPNRPQDANQKVLSSNNFSTNTQPSIYADPIQHAFLHSTKTNQPSVNEVASMQQNQQLIYNSENPFMPNDVLNNKNCSNKQKLTINNASFVGESNEAERQETSKYLDLSKQSNRMENRYQQLSNATNYPKPLDLDVAKSKQQYDIANQGVQKTNYSLPNHFANSPVFNPATQKSDPNFCANDSSICQNERLKESSKVSISDIIQNPSAESRNTLMHPQNIIRTNDSSPLDVTYKQPPLFNTTPSSSMMELTAFMRDFRQTEERYPNVSNPPTNYYDKTHMFAKNITQSNSVANLQQMFNNPMTTMAYGREQQDLSTYQNRMHLFQSQTAANPIAPQIPESKCKKSKKKKNTGTETPNQQLAAAPISQHQLPTNHQQSQFAHQHQQSFQSFPGLKIPAGGTTTSPDPSLSIKSVVPGSAFNYGPSPLTGIYAENSAYLEEFRGPQSSYYSTALRSTESIDKTNPPQAHPSTASSPYHHLLPSHHPTRSYPFMNSLDPATLQQQYRMMFNQTYQAGYHLGMHNQPPPHWHM